MQQNPGRAGRRSPDDEVTVHIPDEVTVHLPRGPQDPSAQAPPPDGVTVLVPGAVLAPAPTPSASGTGEKSVFVDDSGGRKRLLRLVGVLIALLSIGFLGIIGVALAVPDVATSVGLGNVVPYMVPGAAALPAPTPSAAPLAAPKPTRKPDTIAAPSNRAERGQLDPTASAAPTTATTATATATVSPTATQPPSTGTPPTQAPPTGGNPPPIDVRPGGAEQATQN